jgi:hypothetical protein
VKTILQHLPLGNDTQAAGVPSCAAVRRLGALGGTLTTATRPEAISLGQPPARGEIGLTVSVPVAGDYIAWVGGDWFGLVSISVDGRKVGSMREELDWPGLYTDLGSVLLTAGEHLVRIRYDTGGWHPGSGGTPYAFGPVALSRVDAREPVETTSSPQSLCGRRLDWVEAVR